MAVKGIAARLFIYLFVAACLALTVAQPVQAATCIWNPTSGNNWEIGANWSCGVAPGLLDTAVITNVGASPVLNSSPTVARVDINTGTLTSGGILIINSGATLKTGILNLNGQITGPGAVEVTGTWNWGTDPGGLGYLDGRLSGGGQITILNGARGKIHKLGDESVLVNYSINNYGILETFSDFSYLGLADGAAIHNYGTFAPEGSFFDDQFDTIYNSSIINHAGANITIYNKTISGTMLDTALINDGTVNIQKGDLSICTGGPHTGSFSGAAGSMVSFGQCRDYDHSPATTFIFEFSSSLTIPNIQFMGKPGSKVEVYGTFGPLGISTSSRFEFATTFHPGAVINSFGDDVTITNAFTVDTIAPNNMIKLTIGGPLAIFTYSGTINIYTELGCGGNGTLTGGGLLRVLPSGTLRIGGVAGSACMLDGKMVESQGSAYWGSLVNINGLNDATLTNKGTFISQGADTMGGSLTFHNDGSLVKNIAGTTTTIAVPFINDGSIQVNAGSLVFTSDLTLPEGTTQQIIGTLQVANLINDGELTVTGTIDGNLTNNGDLTLKGTITGNLVNNSSLEIGTSPGLAVVQGNYTQSGTGGVGFDVLSPKPGGLQPAAPIPGVNFDQLSVTGTAHLAGHVQLLAEANFDWENFLELPFLTAGGGVIEHFDSVDADFGDAVPWRMIYRSNEVVFKLGGFLFIPMISK